MLSGLEETVNQLIDENLRANGRRSLERGHREATLSCRSCETCCLVERPSSKRSARRTRITKVQEESARHWVTLDEKDDQKIFQDDSSLRRMRRLGWFCGRDEGQA